MAADEIDYNIVFPDAGTSGELHFIVQDAHPSLCVTFVITPSNKDAVKMFDMLALLV